mmetsp:Transcript_53343/g.173452  ORF Transcript_53343/g.173452 Transcript_53343/m.173452 type:complete len:677 (+) Transcript_53343:160-2190(+)
MELKVEADRPSSERGDETMGAAATSTAAVGEAVRAPATKGVEDVFGGLTVGQLIAPGSVGCKLLLHYDLGDAASALHASGKTAAAVADGDGIVVGLLTENDVMRAFFEGALVTSRLDAWFDSGMARASDLAMRRLTVRPSTPLSEIAERMVSNALAGNCACHHVLVEDDAGHLWGVLSALDMVQALIRPETWADSSTPSNQKDCSKPGMKAPWATLSMSVKDVMKSRDDVFTCPPTNTMKEVLKVLLMTKQNSALVVDAHGIYGIVTPRDAVKAFADGEESSEIIADWLAKKQQASGPRLIESTASLADAAALMTANGVNHLVVVLPGTLEAVGTVSSLDLALCDKARTPLLRSTAQAAGPTVGELVSQQWHLTAVCNQGATLREAACLLFASGRTSTALALSDEAAPLRLLTENDIMRAYVYGWEPDATAESWLVAKLIPRCSIPQHVLVPPSVRLTEAAWLMLKAPKPGIDACHHLVVKGAKGSEGGWLGVFSALDLARGLAAIGSELEAARTGADQTRVRAAMKTLEVVPTCKPANTLRQAFSTLIDSRQNAALVTNDDGSHNLVTPRCCLQALAEGVSADCTVVDFYGPRGGPAEEALREVAPELPLLDAAAVMTERTLHHLVVMDPKTSRPMGVLSSLDVARAIASMQSQRPFASLGWLWACKGPSTCTVW